MSLPEPMIEGVLAVGFWMATYAIHSTLLLGAAWLFAKRIAPTAYRAQERWWKGALIGGLITATLHSASGVTPLTGRMELAFENQRDEQPAITREAEVARSNFVPRTAPEMVAVPAPATEPSLVADRAVSAQPAPDRRAQLGTWLSLALAVWAVIASVALSRLALSWIRLRSLLRHRQSVSVTDPGRLGRIARIHEELCRRAGLKREVRLSASLRTSSPITLGVFRNEICLPIPAIHSLSENEQRAMLAHELAHAVRRDPAWLLFQHAIERLFFFQPLNRVARVRQQDLAEYLCDDWAIERIDDPLSLASCLTEVASWVVGVRRSPLVSPMAACGLDTRVRRLVAKHRRETITSRRFLAPFSLAACALVLFGVPAVGVANAEPTPISAGRTDDVTPIDAELARLLADSNTDDPAVALALLDLQIEAIDGEIELMRRETAEIETSDRFEAILTNVEARVRRLRLMREKMLLLLPIVQGSAPASSPQGSQPR